MATIENMPVRDILKANVLSGATLERNRERLA